MDPPMDNSLILSPSPVGERFTEGFKDHGESDVGSVIGHDVRADEQPLSAPTLQPPVPHISVRSSHEREAIAEEAGEHMQSLADLHHQISLDNSPARHKRRVGHMPAVSEEPVFKSNVGDKPAEQAESIPGSSAKELAGEEYLLTRDSTRMEPLLMIRNSYEQQKQAEMQQTRAEVLMAENERLKRELSTFDVNFFDQLEDLKYRYAALQEIVGENPSTGPLPLQHVRTPSDYRPLDMSGISRGGTIQVSGLPICCVLDELVAAQ